MRSSFTVMVGNLLFYMFSHICIYVCLYIYIGFCIETVDLPIKPEGNGESSSELSVHAIQHLYHEAPTLPLRPHFALPRVAVNKAQKKL